jgi:hypothetical protein
MYLLHLKQANNNSPSKRPHQRLPERARRWQGQEFESAFVTLETSEQVICHQAKSPTNVSPKGRDIGRAKIDLQNNFSRVSVTLETSEQIIRRQAKGPTNVHSEEQTVAGPSV